MTGFLFNNLREVGLIFLDYMHFLCSIKQFFADKIHDLGFYWPDIFNKSLIIAYLLNIGQ